MALAVTGATGREEIKTLRCEMVQSQYWLSVAFPRSDRLRIFPIPKARSTCLRRGIKSYVVGRRGTSNALYRSIVQPRYVNLSPSLTNIAHVEAEAVDSTRCDSTKGICAVGAPKAESVMWQLSKGGVASAPFILSYSVSLE